VATPHSLTALFDYKLYFGRYIKTNNFMSGAL
jgi:hypothetical protein